MRILVAGVLAARPLSRAGLLRSSPSSRTARNDASAMRMELAKVKAEGLMPAVVTIGKSNARVLVASMDKVDPEALKAAAEHLLSKLGDPAAVIVGSSSGDGKVSLVATFSPSVVKQGLQAGKVVGTIGGGRPNFAQAGGKQPEKLEAVEKAREDIRIQLS